MFESMVFGVPEDWEPIPDAVLDELGPLPLEPGVPDGADHPDRLVELSAAVGGGTALSVLATVPVELISTQAASSALAALTAVSGQLAATCASYTARLADGEPWRITGTDKAACPAAHEVALATKTSVYAADRAISLAIDLVGTLKATGAALRTGQLTPAHAKTIHGELAGVPADLARTIETRILPRAGTQTIANLTRSLRRARAALDPDWTTHATQARREVVVEHTAHADGTGSLYAHGPLEVTTAISHALSAAATRTRETLGGTTDARKLAALRDWAEAAIAAPTTARTHRRPPVVHITIDLPTLLGLRDHPADLPGIGPIPAAAARWLAADNSPLRRMILDPMDGHCLDYGRTTYQVPPDLAEHLTAVNITSAAPYSDIPATGSDLDHNPAYHQPGGATNRATVTPLDRRWHIARHHGWTYTKNPDTNVITWTSPTGHTLDVHPYDYRAGP
ncbi:MAG TPA: DUF222 domain-containing protein [Mycobacteriales bacterium]|nr:DUF222 domain-containing protein [Mycobacteriales bacterium]